MITRCEFCHFIIVAEEGCPNCYTGKYSTTPKEANDQKDNASADTRKVERPVGAEIMPAPAGQLSLNF
ncbi:MAG: hypothetical protein PHC52_13260 [Syntrophales bacterium]|nr:hypothetical protein [Syntrophales bacterium]